jgi:LuxR family maltose regulon positive regulatory protein
MTMVAADAGCGKTTLISDFIRNQPRPSVWYQLDHTDADPIVFLGYIANGIRNLVPGFGETTFQYLSEATEEFVRFPERAVDLLINEMLQSVEQPFILVLDDYHHIGRDTIVHRLVDRLLQYSSDLVHLIITTRDLPPLAIMRRRTQSDALVITRSDLLFTDDEVRALFRTTLNVELKDDEILEYRTRTHGWITALQLVRQVAEQEIHASETGRAIDLHEVLQQSEKDIFDYFAEEVFAREPESTQKLLLSLSVLESLPLELCSRLFPDLRCSAVLPELAQKNVFLTVAGDGAATEEYRFHPLFRDFLLRRLRSEIGHSLIAEERNRIANYFLDNGQWEKALPFLLDAENFDQAAKMIGERGSEWIAVGAFIMLGLFTERVPAEFLEKYPRSLLHTAEIARLQGETEKSSMLLNRAVVLLRENKDPAGEAEALHSLASLARRRGNVAEALELLQQAEKLATNDSETYLKCANTRGLCLVTEGKWAEAEQQFRFALELAERQSNKHYIRLVTHNLALPPGFRGDFGEALRWFKRIFREDEREKQLPQEAIGHLNISRLHLYRGELDETEKHLERALELCQLYNMKFLRGEIFEAYGNYYRERSDPTHAEEYYERALKAYDDAEIDISTKELNEERARFLLERGDTVRARALLEHLVESREKRSNDIGLQTARLGLAQVDLADGRTDDLVPRISALLEFFHAKNHYYDEALASMLMAEALFFQKNEKDAVPHVQRVLDLSARFDYDYWLRREIRRNPALFAIEEIAERLPADLRDEFSGKRSVDLETSAPTREIIASLTDLTINVLGPVDIFRDVSRPFAADAWTTRRARDIFCYIATSKHRRVAKDVVIDMFWPDEDPATVEKNFHPTISHIRKALNNRQSLKQNFLVFRDGAYQLNPELSYFIDSEEFERHVADAEAAKREKDSERLRASLEAAHALNRGEFMSGIYEDWVDERRNYYTEQTARVTGALAKLALSEKRYAAAQKFASESLDVDPYREDMHRLIMKILAARGKPAAVKKHFNAMRTLFKSELDIEPSPETRRLAAELERER